MLKKPCLKFPKLRYDFCLNDPPPFVTFPKNHSIWKRVIENMSHVVSINLTSFWTILIIAGHPFRQGNRVSWWDTLCAVISGIRYFLSTERKNARIIENYIMPTLWHYLSNNDQCSYLVPKLSPSRCKQVTKKRYLYRPLLAKKNSRAALLSSSETNA